MVKRFLLLAVAMAAPAAAFTPELQGVEETIERIGTKVLWSMGYPECRQGILGFYRPSIDTVIICQGNHRRNVAELLSTLKHEGWHAVQRKCNNNRAALRDDQIRPYLNRNDRVNLHRYHPKQQRAEAEARVVEQIPTTAWIRGVKPYCDL